MVKWEIEGLGSQVNDQLYMCTEMEFEVKKAVDMDFSLVQTWWLALHTCLDLVLDVDALIKLCGLLEA